MNAADVWINFAVEGEIDEAVARKLILHVGAIPGTVYGKQGKSHLRKRIAGYNQAARNQPWLVLVDLDRCSCAPALVQKWVPQPSPYLCLRVAVYEVEAWLLADSHNLANFLGVPQSRIPHAPEQLGDPKKEMVNLASQSRKRDIRRDMVPAPGAGQQVGAAYSARLIEFVEKYWDIHQAASRSPSLQRAIDCLTRLTQQYRSFMCTSPASAP
jgi:hypothetical protein